MKDVSTKQISSMEEESRLVHFPISMFSIVMGLSGLSIAWQKALGTSFPVITTFSSILATTVMLLVSALYLLKITRYPNAVIAETKHPIKINFFAAFSISLLLLSVVWHRFESLSYVLWGLGAVVQLSLTLLVMHSWIHHDHYRLEHANPSWFIPVVGNIIAPITGAKLGFIEISWFFFGVGIVFWLVLLTIIINRLIFHEALPARFKPMLFILLAPPSIGFVSYSSLVPELTDFSRILISVALFTAILLALNINQFRKSGFFLSSWAYSFPVAAFNVALFRYAELTLSPIGFYIGVALLGGLTLLVLWLSFNTLKAIKAGEICKPE
ncbi:MULTISPECIES: SLAC1 anion channel family protein [Vibrio]|uniref:SLAC1 anion channel family protein n=1 Tax=Vibrio navarrensis TaxID=29495 RepID=A0AAJ4IEQ3_9VIBR|nr:MULTISPECIES: SLAC1 anion channel family protein [Vibrio]MBE3657259.1 C4-dicarboxylate ABC transporter [Vibrio navarrensis]MBE4604111.1 C4-dicarboxylate ABC transporter [Vibrio navarrensis]MBG0755845.1 C4-dicarboxylate ABC transporter [Vibrio cidicii]MBG0761755.1 C4-dicarboxylate ABC transporter [Vibrio cidicii]QPL55544.1 SLAC1 anion channel family protein [Vibrio navarrensis]